MNRRIVELGMVSALLGAALASCSGSSRHRTGGGSGGAAGSAGATGGSASGGTSGGGRSSGGASSGGRSGSGGAGGATGGTAGSSAGASTAGNGGAATAGNAGSAGTLAAGGTSAGGEAGAAGEGATGGSAGTGVVPLASYTACTFGSGVARTVIAKRLGSDCTVLVLSLPGSDPFGLDLPQGIGVESAFRSTIGPNLCLIPFPPNGADTASSGSGTVSDVVPTAALDVTLTFDEGDAGLPTSERLVAEDIPSLSPCP